jgi:lipid II:glycine glycyltransferase (peptidoglycan interpeptide bridge formation enzyme)
MKRLINYLDLSERKRQLNDKSETLAQTMHTSQTYCSNELNESSLNGQQMGLELNQNYVLMYESNPNLNCINVMISETSNSVVNHFESQELVSKENSISISKNNNDVMNA